MAYRNRSVHLHYWMGDNVLYLDEKKRQKIRRAMELGNGSYVGYSISEVALYHPSLLVSSQMTIREHSRMV